MRRNRKVKILATIGPASSSEEMLRKLFEAGADVFRINMSHTDHELMRTLVGRIRAVEAAIGRPIGILADLQGPKLRVGKFANGKEALTAGQTFTLDDNPQPVQTVGARKAVFDEFDIPAARVTKPPRTTKCDRGRAPGRPPL